METTEKTFFQTGCYIAGHNGWRAIGELVLLAELYGFSMPADDWNKLFSFMDDGDFLEEVVNMSDEALDYMNSITEDGFVWTWQDGELFVWTVEDLAALGDEW